jgi:radical SAM superfamily enzyme YgiQ (UPF0313 family)
MKSILLINPKYRLEIRWIANENEIGVKADYFPLGLSTVAALTPDNFHVDIWDELVRGLVEESHLVGKYDLVGVTSHSANLGRAAEIGRFFRQQGILTAVGGPGVTSNPNRCRDHFDVLFIGEAELIWPQFLKEWQIGSYRSEYRQIEKPDLSLSPVPKWDSLACDVKRYAMGTVQTTRGCPIDCEFCDVIYLNGRRQRYKPIEQVIKEVRVLEQLGVRSVSFNDDNFTVNHRRAKEVLRALIPMNKAFPKPLRFMTQLGIDISRDDELLELLADANFYEVLIGIETPNKEALRETGKYNNLKGNLAQEVKKVLSYGIAVRGAMIVGFDHDEIDIFDQQYDFIQQSCLPSISLHMLNAPVGTRLWRRLREEGRVIDAFDIADNSTQRLFNNIIPKRMTRVELMQGFRNLYASVFTWESFKERMFAFVSLVRRPPNVPQESVPIRELLDLGPSMNLDTESCNAMAEIFMHTEQTAPFMLGRVKELVIQFIRYRNSAHEFIPGLERQIKLESSGKIKIKLDSRPVPIPEVFRKAFKSIFPSVHHRVRENLFAKNKVAEALVDIFVDFLVHEEGFEQMEDQHLALLNEIADRTCDRFNSNSPEEPVDVKEKRAEKPEVDQIRLKDDILIGIEHELMKMKLTQKKAETAQCMGYA